MKLYKILEKGKSCHGGSLSWELPKDKPGAWHEISGDLALCKNGIHLTDKPSAWFRWNCEIYEAEYDGEIIWDKNENKCVVRKARLLKKVEPPQWWTLTHQFMERDIPSIRWLKPDNKPLNKWKLFKADAWNAARDAARNAAWNAARDAGLMSTLKVVSDLKIDKRHINHINERWEVWQKGYALACDVKGILYVYAKEIK